MTTLDPRRTQAGVALQSYIARLDDQHLRDLLHQPGRIANLTFESGDLTVDITRARADEAVIGLLADLAEELQVPQTLQAMVRGENVNSTEHRPALHTALRLPTDQELSVGDENITDEVRAVYQRIDAFVDAVHDGGWRGHTGKRIESIVNIGIGGSDLGPRMAVRALRQFHKPNLTVRFVANVDPADLSAVLADLDPETTMFVVVSKTFTTIETLTNAQAARSWLTDSLGDDAVGAHMVAVSAATARAVDFGIAASAVFGFWDWVGGRFSLSSPVGLSIQLAVGSDAMRELRAGMHRVDVDLVTQPTQSNGAVMLGMLDVWYSSFLQYRDKAIVAYAQDLELFPAHLQQLLMESNGKSVTREGDQVTWLTSPAVWGATGTNGQHAFFQMLHQGTDNVALDLIGVIKQPDDQRALLLQANLVAQASALANGQSAADLIADGLDHAVVPHRTMPGNRPSTVVLMPQLDPYCLGQLIALYESATVVSGLAWGINPFDQWGVELGKQVASTLLPTVTGGPPPAGIDPATQATLDRLRSTSG